MFCLAMKAAKPGTPRTLVAGTGTLGGAATVVWLTAAVDLLLARVFGSGRRDGGNQGDLLV
jgi:hypothetical protein